MTNQNLIQAYLLILGAHMRERALTEKLGECRVLPTRNQEDRIDNGSNVHASQYIKTRRVRQNELNGAGV